MTRILLLTWVAALLLTPVLPLFPVAQAEGANSAPEAFERGPHRGRMLLDGDFALEVTIFETGVPPQFRLYAYRNDQPLPASQVEATVELTRLGGGVDRFTFKAEGEYLTGGGTVLEPHSFDVAVTATASGTPASVELRFLRRPDQYSCGRGRVGRCADRVVRSRRNSRSTTAHGHHHAGREPYGACRTFPRGRSRVRAGLGDTVTAGQVLAVVESNESLKSYAVTAPISSVVTARSTNAGDVAGGVGLVRDR